MIDHCPIHEKQVSEIDSIHVIVAEIANNVLWLTRIGKWALGVCGAAVIIAITSVGFFNGRIYDLTTTVKQSEVRIATLINAHENSRKIDSNRGEF